LKTDFSKEERIKKSKVVNELLIYFILLAIVGIWWFWDKI